MAKVGFTVKHRFDRSITDLDVVIIADNVKEMGEMMALCTLKNFLPYRKVKKYYFDLIRDLDRQNDIARPLFDGYDFAQTAICFLCEHMGKSLGDTVMGKYKRPVPYWIRIKLSPKIGGT